MNFTYQVSLRVVFFGDTGPYWSKCWTVLANLQPCRNVLRVILGNWCPIPCRDHRSYWICMAEAFHVQSPPVNKSFIHRAGLRNVFGYEAYIPWLLEHRRKPRSHAEDPVESRQATRLNVGYNYLQQQIFSETLVAALWRCFPIFCISLKLRLLMSRAVPPYWISMCFNEFCRPNNEVFQS